MPHNLLNIYNIVFTTKELSDLKKKKKKQLLECNSNYGI